MLTGGEVHWSGTATRTFNASWTDPEGSGSQTQDSGRSKISWDTRILLSGYYPDDPQFDRPEGGIVFATSSTENLGHSSWHHYELDCYSPGDCLQPTTQDCSWDE